jgi:proteasome beta subunit
MEKKTGTTTVGLVCRDCSILVAEKRATLGYLVESKEAKKIYKIDSHLGITTAGSVGDVQTIVRYLQAEANIYKYQKGKEMPVRAAVVLLANILQSSKIVPFLGQFIIAGFDENGPSVFSLDPVGGIGEGDKYYSTGSGSPIAFGVLEDLFKDNMSMEDGIKVGLKAVRAATKRDISSGDGITVAVIDKRGFRELTKSEVDKYLSA